MDCSRSTRGNVARRDLAEFDSSIDLRGQRLPVENRQKLALAPAPDTAHAGGLSLEPVSQSPSRLDNGASSSPADQKEDADLDSAK